MDGVRVQCPRLTAQFEERRVEPNSGLGEAITYMRKHWDKLTLFLRHPAAPLDNNVCEQALKKAILPQKELPTLSKHLHQQLTDLLKELHLRHGSPSANGGVQVHRDVL